MNKKIFKARVAIELVPLGYCIFPASVFPGEYIFYKKIEDYVLSLGITISSKVKEHFTASFYLSTDHCYSYTPPDFPVNAYKRITVFLQQNERQEYLLENYQRPGLTAGWWTGFNEENIKKLVEVIKITESRFLGQLGVVSEVSQCKSLKVRGNYIDSTIVEYHSSGEDDSINSENCKRLAGNMDKKWFVAAEKALKANCANHINSQTIRLLAVDAWFRDGQKADR